MGKALGGATGGYTASNKAIVDILRQRARPYLFSNTLAPSVVSVNFPLPFLLYNFYLLDSFLVLMSRTFQN